MKLNYHRFGSGPPLIILHGLFGISDNWVTLGRRLAEQFSVYIPDQRNHGRSPHSDTMNYFVLKEDLHEFITGHKLSNPVLIGHSMGGKVVMNYVLEHGNDVASMIVLDISPRRYPGRQIHMEIIDAIRSVNFDLVHSRQEVEQIIAGRLRSERIIRFILKNLYRINTKRLAWRLNIDAISDHLEEMFSGIQSPEIFEGPALFIRGGKSDYITDIDFTLIRKNFPATEFKTIQDASHWIHADAPEELCAMLSNFLGKHCSYKVEDGG
ncbi:MAG: alpha/beta fold hydrolase [Bacteroidales bacterium]|nr:alpha/beta fold hydrolase [Bacteroidales bacterium]